jgi:hypothetical protein
MAKRFPTSNVRILKVYQVDCDVCQDAVDTADGMHGALTRARAEDAKRSHVDWHRRMGAEGR